jgi:hypothetical protein
VENIDWTSILIQVALCWFFFRLGQASMLKSIAKDLVENLKDKGIELDIDQDGDLVVKKESTILVIERVGVMYYAYAESGEFIAQGVDFTALFTSIKSRFPNQSFKIDKDQKTLSEDEVKQMTTSVFQIFGEKDNDGQRGQHLG